MYGIRLAATSGVIAWSPPRPAPRPLQVPSSSAALVLLALVGIAGATVTSTVSHSMPRSAASVGARAQGAAPQTLAALPLGFEANAGQGPAGAQFVARTSGYSLALTPAVLAFALAPPKGSNAAPSVVRMTLLGANPAAAGTGEGVQNGRVNYLLGKDPTQWFTGIARYAQIVYHRAYPGIDVVYHSNAGRLEYDFVVAPGANTAVIRLGFEGVRGLSVDAAGALLLPTAAGTVRLHAPHLYQDLSRGRRAVTGRFALDAHGRVGFAVGAYDRSRPLVIDPTIAFSTYIGGTSDDDGNSVAIDSAGNVYITGITASSDWPATSGAYQTTNPTGTYTGQVSKFSPTGALVYSTYLGGTSGTTRAVGIGVDSSGDAIVDGETGASDYPTTAGAFETSPTGSAGSPGFLTKLNASGSGLVYSTYVGDGIDGESDEGAQAGVSVDSSGNAYFAAPTCASDFPTTTGAFQTSRKGCNNMVVAKFTSAGALVYSTYVGGSGNDAGRSIAVDSSGNAYVEGITSSSDFPVTTGAFQTTNKGNGDAFVFKLNPTGTGLVYATYLGGSGGEFGDSSDHGGIAIDPSGDAYVTAGTTSSDFPVTTGAFQTTLKAGNNAFVSELNPSGSGLVYSTYLGGTGSDTGREIAVDSAGDAFVVGDTVSSDFPLVRPTQAAYGGGQDGFVTKIAPGGASLLFSTYLGGSGYENPKGIALQGGTLAVTGATGSSDFPTVKPFQASNAGPGDGFVTSYNIIDLLNLTQSASTTLASEGQSVTYTMAVSNDGSDGDATGVTLTDPLPAGVTYVSATPSQGSCSQSGGTVTCALGPLPANSSAGVTITVTTPNASATLVNTATVSADQTDPDPYDNTATTTVYVDAADLSITQKPSAQPARDGQALTYTLGIANAGPNAATHVSVVDPLPADVTFTSATATQGSCTQTAGTVTCALGAMAEGDTATVIETTTVHDQTGTSLVNTATVSSDEVDQNASNNSATTTTLVNGPGCGETITKTTTLTADIGPCLANGVIIGTDHITLNLNGHRIFGRSTRQDDIAGIRLPVRVGVTVENGSLDSFSEGIFVNSGSGNTIKKMNVHDNVGPPNLNADFGDGLLLESSAFNKVLTNTFTRNGTFDNIGIFGLDANYNVIQGNTLTNSVTPGVTFGGGQGVGIDAFLFLGDPRRGNSLWGNNVIGNTITGNQGAGISSVSNVNGKYEHNTIENNGDDPFNFPDNGIGLQNDANATANTNDLVAYNTILGNGQDGIQALNTFGNRILNNTTGGNNANSQGYYDLEDTNGNCSSNTWLNNTYGSGGVNPACLASTNQGPPAAAARASQALPPHAASPPRRYVPAWKGVS